MARASRMLAASPGSASGSRRARFGNRHTARLPARYSFSLHAPEREPLAVPLYGSPGRLPDVLFGSRSTRSLVGLIWPGNG